MKKTLYFCFSLVLFYSACKKDDVPVNIFEPGSMEFGSAMAEKNGSHWLASAEALKEKNYKDYFSLSFATYNMYDEKRESISFSKIPFSVGSYPATTCVQNIPDSCMPGYVSSLYGRFSSDGDAVLAFYTINERKTNYLNITAIDTVTNIVKGDFEIHVKIESGEQFLGPADPSNLDFTKGSFECRFSN